MKLPGNPGIDNTAFLFFVLAAAFAFFITVRGDLPKWLGLFGLAGSSPTAGSPRTLPFAPASTGPDGLPALPMIPKIGQ